MEGGCDRWVDLSALTDDGAAKRILGERVDVLVDLNGQSKGGRPGILLRGPAPVRLAFLGFPATSGGAADYIGADARAAPPEIRAHFAERLFVMPHSYICNDYRRLHPRPLAPAADDGAQVPCGGRGGGGRGGGGRRCFVDAAGQPHRGAVLANFGQMYKIEPALLDAWCAACEACVSCVCVCVCEREREREREREGGL